MIDNITLSYTYTCVKNQIKPTSDMDTNSISIPSTGLGAMKGSTSNNLFQQNILVGRYIGMKA